MKADQNKYPVFEANQVLTNAHLNQVFNYLDEQNRLTRANLIGIGIVCGLDATLNSAVPEIKISMGCGIPSEGYLILLPQEVTLVSYKKYKLPKDLPYDPFTFLTGSPLVPKPFDLWEMFEVGEPDSTLFTTGFLSTKVILLFLELKKDELRNCSPKNCDDKGEEVTITLRKLLIEKADADKIIIKANALQDGMSSADIAATFSAKMNLPDLRLPRFNVPNSSLSSSAEVYNSFIHMIKKEALAAAMSSALSAAYTAFKPLLQKDYPSDPFTGFNSAFGFLDTTPTNTTQVKFLQYYTDFFDDLIKAYEEFRWAGIELTCLCCPSEALFPRHLFLGEVVPTANAFLYRHTFMPSPASCCECEKETEALVLLFRRLVDITLKFTNTPLIPTTSTVMPDPQIRITPSKLADVAGSEKCIPFYYLQNGNPPLYQSWNPTKTLRGKANQNLSYRADEYATANFVKKPLEYDLEPYNFLRIEGHLGKNYIQVLQSLITLRQQNRLPFEIIALRTGAFDENMTVDLSKEECRFQDLETLYDVLREESLHEFCEGIISLYEVVDEKITGIAGTPQMALIKKYAPTYRHKQNSVGAWYESQLSRYQAMNYLNVDQNNIDINDLFMVHCVLFFGTTGLPPEYYAHVVAIYYLSKIAEILPASFDDLGFDDFENKYQDLRGLVRLMRSEAARNLPATLTAYQPQEDLIDHFDSILLSGKYEPIAALHEEYARRIKEVKQKQFLSYFLINNPGIQHKAGVPLGGTFILVYHQNASKKQGGKGVVTDSLTAEPVRMVAKEKTRSPISKNLRAGATGMISEEYAQIAPVLEKLITRPEYYYDQDFQFIYSIYSGGYIPSFEDSGSAAGLSDLQKMIRNAVRELTDGTVIADFYLPYICCSDCAPIQFVLPKTPPVFTTAFGCTNENNVAQVTVTPEGGVAPYSIKIDDADYTELGTNSLLLSSGEHTFTIKDAEGTESDPKSITVPGILTIGAETYTDNLANNTWQVVFPISGGTAPYTTSGGTGTVSDSTFTSIPNASGATLPIQISDSKGCIATRDFTHTVEAPCKLPCDGIAKKCGYRFWMPVSSREKFYNAYTPRVKEFSFIDPTGNKIDLAEKVNDIISLGNNVQDLNTDFNGTVDRWIDEINKVIQEVTGSKDWLILSYDQEEKETFGILWIEYFECLEFRFDFTIIYAKPEMQEVLNTIYSKDGTTVIFVSQTTGGQQEARLALFNCILINKCDPDKPIKKIFKEPDSKLEISKKLTDRKVSFEAKPVSGDKPTSFFWEFENGIPAVTNEKAPTVNYQNSNQKVNAFQLTTFTKNGGRVVISDTVSLSGHTPRAPLTPKNIKAKTKSKASTKTKPATIAKPRTKPSVKKAIKSIPPAKSTS
ncbi:MAG TPA: hypothetical protein VLA46_03045, partial [Saprospiraceae bacterium]|nr:hypothetical protein [Saprospiraceae bacterium]